jgi:hypothetical protein
MRPCRHKPRFAESDVEAGVSCSDSEGEASTADLSWRACHSDSRSSCGDAHDSDAESIPADSLDADEHVEELRQIVLTKCSFMRLQSFNYRRTDPSTPAGRAGITGSLMFYMGGLPWTRRGKWLIPLRLCISKFLDDSGYHTCFSGGRLIVSDASESFKVRVDFAVAMASQ